MQNEVEIKITTDWSAKVIDVLGDFPVPMWGTGTWMLYVYRL